MSDLLKLKSSVEALLFISGEGLNAKDISHGLQAEEDDVRMVLDTLVEDYLERDGGIFIEQSGNRYRFKTKAQVYPDIQMFLKEKKEKTLSKSMLETLAIITYKQPLTLYDIEEIRGVKSRPIVTSLMQKQLVRTMGQKEAPGKPMLYGTTKEFLHYFGLNSLEELPSPQEVKEFNFDEL